MSYSNKLQDIRNEIINNNVKVVSFDVFDTLLVRPCLEPTDLFRVVKKRLDLQYDFVTLRKYAEKYARKNKPFYYDDITIDEIYVEFQKLAEVDEFESKCIMDMEMQVEEDYLKPRETIKELYYDFLENGKKIIITSDMYLPKSFLEQILRKNGYTGYDYLFVSSEERVSKGSGRLFQKIIKLYAREDILVGEIAHLGDNTRVDVAVPKNLGLKAYHLPATSNIFRSKKKLEPLWKYGKRTDNTFIAGTLANYMFDDPYKPFNSMSISNGEAICLGSILFGQMFLIYSKWLCDKMQKDNNEKMILVYRDGYLLDNIFNVIKAYIKLPFEIDKIYLSRRVRYPFYAEEKNGLLNSLDVFSCSSNMTVREFINKRVCIEKKDTEKVWNIFKKYGYADMDEELGDTDRYYFFLNELMPYFYNNAKKNIYDTKAYVLNKIENKHVSIVDIGYRGSVSRFITDKIGINNCGYQLMSTPLNYLNVKGEYNIDSFYTYSFGMVDKFSIFHQLLEDIISIQEGSAISVKKKNKRYTIKKEENFAQSEVITEIQQGIFDYIKYAIDKLYFDFLDMEFDKQIYFDFLEDFFVNPTELDAKIIKKLSFKDSSFVVCDSKKDNPYVSWFNEKFPTKKEIPKTVVVNSQTKTQSVASQSDLTQQVVGQPIEGYPMPEVGRFHMWAIKVCTKLNIIDLAINVKAFLFKKNKKVAALYVEKQFINPIDEKIAYLEQKNNIKFNNKQILIAGAMTSFDKGTCNFINNLAKEIKSDVCLMSENKFLNEERTRQKITFPFFLIPDFLCKDQYDKIERLYLDKKVKRIVDKTDYLKWGKENLIQRHVDMNISYAYYMVYYADIYVKKMLDIVKPEKIIMWNEFYAFHHILKNNCQDRNVEIIYMEFGSLPGTISLEKIGQMGKSFPGLKCEQFSKLPVNNVDLNVSKNLLSFLKESKLNRNVQPVNNNIEDIKSQLKKGRPVIFYAGVNDYESGLVPYTSETKKYHSPMSKSSNDGLAAIINVVVKNDWNLIYKPHPIIEKNCNDFGKYGDNVIIARDVDVNDVIDISDVVVTILSQVCYLALIRNKAVMMLGYTQLREKHVCYEAYSKKDVAKVLEKAVEEGFTKEQRETFVKHIAQLNKYNLFDDLQNKPLKYGQSIKSAARFVEECDNSVDWYRMNCFSEK